MSNHENKYLLNLNNLEDMDDETVDSVLLAAYYRSECPDTMKLGHYRLGLLSGTQYNQLRTHIESCPHCHIELDNLSGLLDEEVWQPAHGFDWRRSDAGALIIRILDALIPLAPLPTPIAVRRQSVNDDSDIIRSAKLSTDKLNDLEVTATVRQDPTAANDAPSYKLEIEAIIPSLGIGDLSGTSIKVMAGKWQMEGSTDEDGLIEFEGFPNEGIEELIIEVEAKET